MINACTPCRTTAAAAYQDQHYGAGQRVHNERARKIPGDAPRGRCTVCGTEREMRE